MVGRYARRCGRAIRRIPAASLRWWTASVSARCSIARVCIVADRGMISAETIAELEARGLLYILGVRERTDKVVRELVLDDPAPFVPLAINKRGRNVNYEAKAVELAARRYIVCRNHEEAKKDAADRAAILAALERQLKKGDKALVGNGGYRRFLATTGENRFVIDRAKAEEVARFDGRPLRAGPITASRSAFSWFESYQAASASL